MRYQFEQEENSERWKKAGKELVIWVIELILVIGAAYLFVHVTLEEMTHTGNAMETTLQSQDKLLINKFAYVFKGPKRFDLIAFKQNGAEHNYYTVRRVIGLPGETVLIKDGKVWIDGKELEEKVTVELMETPGLAQEGIKLDENEYFVLGDNRNNSEDSRFASVGNIIRSDIVGKAWIRIKPFSFINQIKGSAHPKETEE